jgi:uncharacterized protein
MHHQYALITGCGSGLGKALAEECAKRNYHLILVSLPGRDLEDTYTYLRQQYQVEVHSLSLDLCDMESHTVIRTYLDDHKIRLHLLINNAGLGSAGAFQQEPFNLYSKMLQLNINNTVLLTHTLIPYIDKGGHILNTGSAGGFFDMPYKLVYSATKRFIYGFSRGLRLELRKQHIGVTVLCPGGINTNDAVRARVAKMMDGENIGLRTRRCSICGFRRSSKE